MSIQHIYYELNSFAKCFDKNLLYVFWAGPRKETLYNWGVVKFLRFLESINLQLLPSDLFG